MDSWVNAVSFGFGAIAAMVLGVHAVRVAKRPPVDRSFQPPLLATQAKCILVTLATFLSLVDIYEWPRITQLNPLGLLAPIAQACASVAALLLHYVQHTRSIYPSDFLLLYWPVSIVLSLCLLRHEASVDHLTLLVSRIFYLLSALAVFCLELRAAPDNPLLLLNDDSGPCIYGNAHIYSRISFSWVTPVIDDCRRKQSRIADNLFQTPILDSETDHATMALSSPNKELRRQPLSLLGILCKGHATAFATSGVCLLLTYVCRAMQPIVLKLMIQYFQATGTPEDRSVEYGLVLCVCMAVPGMGKIILSQTHWEYTVHPWLQFIKTLSALVYRKVLRMSNETKAKHSTGQIVAYISVDIEQFSSFVRHAHELWVYPLQVIILMHMLYKTIGWSSLVGVGLLVADAALGFCLAGAVGASTKQFLRFRDKRMRMVSEAIGNFKAVKLYAWERAFMAKIEGIRNNEELAAVRQMGVSKVLIALTGGLTSIVVTLGTFGAYMIFGCESHGPLTSQLIFVSLSLFFLLQEPVSGWPRALSSFAAASRSYDRLNAFLMCPDRDPEAISRLEYDRYRESASANDVLVDVSSASFKWNACEGTTLEDISFECRREELVAVIGKVGSGKSSIISALLGDLVKTAGSVTLHGSVAFVPQQPWIVNTTLRNNILFGNKLEQEFYDRVIDACALRADLVMMSGGDMTEIGEKGFNLSGGQKARVALARAVYARADIYLLDDPLSAVDVQVGKHIFSHVLGPTGLLRNRARIFATNNLQDLRGVDRVLLLQDCRLMKYGTFMQTTNFPREVLRLMQGVKDNGVCTTHSSATPAAETGIWMPVVAERTSMAADANVIGRHCTIGRAERDGTWVDNNHGIRTSATGEHAIIKDDVEHFGQVGVDVFRHYVRACGVQNVAWLLLSVIATMLLVMGGSFWLAHWAHTNEENKRPSQPGNSLYHLLIYAAIGAGSGVSSMVTLVLLWLVCASDGSRRIHSQILHSIFQVPISLLDSIPIGRILGLFGSDLAKVDIVIPGCVDIWVQSGIEVAVSIILISMTSLFSLLFLPPLVYLFVSIQKRSIPATRDVRRLINKLRDTIITGIEEAVHGVVSIRAYSQERRFEVSSEAKIERYMAALWTYECADRWLIFRLDSICVAILLFVALMLVGIQHFSGHIDSGFASLTLTYAMSMLGMVNICLRSSALLEMSMVSVERLRDYSFLESEERVAASGHSGPPCWPETGDIEFRNYSARYRKDLDPVLNDLSFKVLPSQKVGIVGRTGAGKSSLALAMLRIIEPDSGQILLDGQDISKHPLHDVRSRVSIIPQDPVMFSGTVRENLDPFGSYSDGEIWRALDNSHMGEFIRSKNERLEFVVTQGGENFSVGQRQLICFARALLRRTKILVLDEATSAIDASTDTAIQQTIRKEFKGCTVLTIAHRLSTVLDSDRVLVIDRGRAVEYDSPQKLLANSRSMFSQLVADTKDKSCK